MEKNKANAVWLDRCTQEETADLVTQALVLLNDNDVVSIVVAWAKEQEYVEELMEVLRNALTEED